MRHALYIAGPTGVGKSELAVKVAERCGGEIIGADAFQVYDGLDLLTAKPSPVLRSQVPHHLISAIPLPHAFDVAQYLERVNQITAHVKFPIFVGGTGLYFRALIRGLSALPKTDPHLRAELEQASLGDLQTRLKILDADAPALIDLKNKRRVLRAIEICALTGRPLAEFRKTEKLDSNGAAFFLTREREDLYDRINRRVEAMFRAGVVEEIAAMGDIGPTASGAIGLKEIRSLIEGAMSEQECIEKIQQATRRYAKRQLTWFKREPMFEPINLTSISFESAAELISQKASRAFLPPHV